MIKYFEIDMKVGKDKEQIITIASTDNLTNRNINEELYDMVFNWASQYEYEFIGDTVAGIEEDILRELFYDTLSFKVTEIAENQFFKNQNKRSA